MYFNKEQVCTFIVINKIYVYILYFQSGKVELQSMSGSIAKTRNKDMDRDNAKVEFGIPVFIF